MLRSHLAIALFVLVLAASAPSAAAVVPHVERSIGVLTHRVVVDGQTACVDDGVFYSDTARNPWSPLYQAGAFMGSSDCGDIVDGFTWCSNGDTEYHDCESDHSWMTVIHSAENSAWPMNDIHYERVGADGALDVVTGSAYWVPVGDI